MSSTSLPIPGLLGYAGGVSPMNALHYPTCTAALLPVTTLLLPGNLASLSVLTSWICRKKVFFCTLKCTSNYYYLLVKNYNPSRSKFLSLVVPWPQCLRLTRSSPKPRARSEPAHHRPRTSGALTIRWQVIVHTTRGEIAIELWAKARTAPPPKPAALSARFTSAAAYSLFGVLTAGGAKGRAQLCAACDGRLLRRLRIPQGADTARCVLTAVCSPLGAR